MIVAHGQARRDVAKNDSQTERFGENSDLAANPTIPDDAETLPPYLERSRSRLLPMLSVHLPRVITQMAREHDHFRDDHFRNAAGVGKGSVEDGNAPAVCAFEVDLIGADAEAADRQQPSARRQHGVGDARLASNAEQMHVLDAASELLRPQ